MMKVSPAVRRDANLSSVHFDAIRGFAALVVMMGHARVLFLKSFTGASQAHLSHSLPTTYGKMVAGNMAANGNSIGHEAVMVFFVLSGFLVGGSVLKLMKRNAWSWQDYLVKRLTRLWMVLIPALLLGIILDHAGMHVFSNPHSIYSGPVGQTLVAANLSGRYSLSIILGNLAFLQNICVPTAGTNVALWSLSNEFWYYMAFPLLLLGLHRGTAFWHRVIFTALFAGIMAGIGWHSSRLFLVWVLGAVLSVLPLKVPKPIAKWGAMFIAIILSLGFIWVKKHILNLAASEFIIALIFACLLYLLLHQRQKAKNGLYSFVAAATAKMSYTLYLVHVPILIFLCACVNNPWRIWPATLPNIAVITSVGGITIAFAFVFYLLFEANTDLVRNYITQKMVRRTA